MWLGWIVTASIAKNANAIAGERRREPVHVVEQVERVRHPDEPEQRERPRDRPALWINCTSVPVASTMTAAANWRASFASGGSATQVVDQPGDEEDA